MKSSCVSRMLMRRRQCSYRTAMLGDSHRCTGALDLCQEALSFALASVDVTAISRTEINQ
jgi:hypothetical protein